MAVPHTLAGHAHPSGCMLCMRAPAAPLKVPPTLQAVHCSLGGLPDCSRPQGATQATYTAVHCAVLDTQPSP